jgi:hypothetical protein
LPDESEGGTKRDGLAPMSRLRWFVFSVAVLTAFYLVREPLFRPNKATVLSWLNGEQILVVPGSDSHSPVLEAIDSGRLQDLKYEDGTIYRPRFWFPQIGVATYSFRYPLKNSFNSYDVDIRYAFWPKFGWVRRERQGVRISGPNNRARLAALGVK